MRHEVFKRFYTVIRRIPRGRVATYGQIARLAGLPHYSRQVGYALAAVHEEKLPWHRVINSQGGISPRAIPHFAAIQRKLLEKEGVTFNSNSQTSLRRFQWKSSYKSRLIV